MSEQEDEEEVTEDDDLTDAPEWLIHLFARHDVQPLPLKVIGTQLVPGGWR